MQFLTTFSTPCFRRDFQLVHTSLSATAASVATLAVVALLLLLLLPPLPLLPPLGLSSASSRLGRFIPHAK